MKSTIFSIISAFVLLSAVPAFAQSGLARFRALQEESKLSGRVLFKESADGMTIKVSLFQAPPGKHGIHVHEFGDCEGDGTAAGSHYNPEGTEHGFITKDGIKKAHAGDLGNIEVGQDGTGSLELLVPNLTLNAGAHAIAGRSVILHEKEDDFGQPVGNAGGRIACGTIVIVGE